MYFGLENKNKRISTLVNYILHVVKWELWEIRNLVKYETKRITLNPYHYE